MSIAFSDISVHSLHIFRRLEFEMIFTKCTSMSEKFWNWKCALLDQTCFYLPTSQTSISVTFIHLCVAATISLAKVLLYHKLQSSARENEFTHLLQNSFVISYSEVPNNLLAESTVWGSYNSSVTKWNDSRIQWKLAV